LKLRDLLINQALTSLQKSVDQMNTHILAWETNGKIGYKDKINRMWEEHQTKKTSSQGLVDWAFRAIITILVGYVALKIGLK